jgi:hypothetical protein
MFLDAQSELQSVCADLGTGEVTTAFWRQFVLGGMGWYAEPFGYENAADVRNEA